MRPAIGSLADTGDGSGTATAGQHEEEEEEEAAAEGVAEVEREAGLEIGGDDGLPAVSIVAPALSVAGVRTTTAAATEVAGATTITTMGRAAKVAAAATMVAMLTVGATTTTERVGRAEKEKEKAGGIETGETTAASDAGMVRGSGQTSDEAGKAVQMPAVGDVGLPYPTHVNRRTVQPSPKQAQIRCSKVSSCRNSRHNSKGSSSNSSSSSSSWQHRHTHRSSRS